MSQSSLFFVLPAVAITASVASDANAQTQYSFSYVSKYTGRPGDYVQIATNLDDTATYSLNGVPMQVVRNYTGTNVVIPANATSGYIKGVQGAIAIQTPKPFVVVPLVRLFKPAPTSAGSATVTPGSTITFYDGWNFDNVVEVKFTTSGTATPTSVSGTFTIVDARQLTAVVPAGISGHVRVTLRNPAGWSQGSGEFEVDATATAPAPSPAPAPAPSPAPAPAPAPTTTSAPVTLVPTSISGFTPPSGGVGDTVMIQGQGFQRLQYVTFGSTPAPFKIISGTQVAAQVPSGPTMFWITVGGPDGTSKSANVFLPKPIITTAETSVRIGGKLTVEGYNFNRVRSATIGGVDAPIATAARDNRAGTKSLQKIVLSVPSSADRKSVV